MNATSWCDVVRFSILRRANCLSCRPWRLYPSHVLVAVLTMQYTFPKDTDAAIRENVVRAPGPGHYNIHPGVGKQV